jgi:hypothetical protein
MIACGHTVRIIQRGHPLAALAKLSAVTAKAACRRFTVGPRASRHLEFRIPRSSSFSVQALQEAGSSYLSVHRSMVRPDFLPSCDCTSVSVLCRAYCSVLYTFLASTCKPMIPFAHCQNEITLFQQKFRFIMKPTNIDRICTINTKQVLRIASIFVSMYQSQSRHHSALQLGTCACPSIIQLQHVRLLCIAA